MTDSLPPRGPGSDRPRLSPRDASGIFARRTGFMKAVRSPTRTRFFRPPAWWSLFLLTAALVLGGAAGLHRRSLDRRFAAVLSENRGAPAEIQRLRHDLSDLELDEEALQRELDARLKFIEHEENDEFYVVLDTKKKSFSLRLGDSVVRDGELQVGSTEPISSRSGKRWTFAPLTGAFNVKSKAISPTWKAPEWVYEAAGRAAPKPLPAIPGGLGKYVVELSEGYVIHSPPPPASPLQGVKRGSFLVPEADLAAIWRRLGPGTRVYIF